MTPERPSKDALVLSGGGALGAYEVGVMKALFSGNSPATRFQPLDPEIFTGTSIGAFNGAFMASRGIDPPTRVVDELEAVWRGPLSASLASCGTDAYRIRWAPFTLDPGCLARPVELLARGVADAAHWAGYAATRSAAFLASGEPPAARVLETIDLASLVSDEPFGRLVRDTVPLDGLAASPDALAVATTNWLDGACEIFSKTDILDRVGIEAIRASAAVPGIFPPVEIDGAPHVDGALLLNTPIRPAIRDGAEVIHVVYVDPEVARVPLPPVPDTFSTINRSIRIVQAKQISFDVANAREIGRELLALRREGILGDDLRTVRGDAPDHLRAVRRIRSGRRPYRPLTIHRYRPRRPLGSLGSFFDFRAGQIDQWIALGVQDAIGHDCAAEGCVLDAERPLARRGERRRAG